jgi:Ni,Fe-hydrogenase III small subunit
VKLIDIDSCSACLSTVFSLLKNNKDFIDKYFTPEKPLNIAIGKGIKQSDIYSDTFLIGNCTFEQSEKGIFIKGCTPVESTILEIIKENLKKKK